MYMSIQKELEDLRTARNTTTPMPGNISIFTATSKEGVERYELMFPNSAKRKEWERTILELKRQLSSVKRMARFNEAVQIPRTLPGIQIKTASVAAVSASVDLNIHKRKTKVLKFNTENTNPITLDDETLEDVKSSTYLGSIIDEQGGSDAEVKAWIGKARAAFLQLKNI
ncbi:unnamed protein product [Schistosoma mattheei]|uniref:Uncharacterized protein n=1 Tax=Schistosoma mattheei TaxID=31246 RepID=A0A183PPU4_9TREM|nr:unnamed protein product [Schistosoma mattheei]